MAKWRNIQNFFHSVTHLNVQIVQEGSAAQSCSAMYLVAYILIDLAVLDMLYMRNALNRRASILPNTLIDLHLGRRDEGALSPMRQMPTRSPVGSIERLLSPLVKPQTKLGTSSAPVQNSAIGDGEYLPEDYVFRMGSSDHINGEVLFICLGGFRNSLVVLTCFLTTLP